MELIEISRPARPQNGEILFGTPIPPIDKLLLLHFYWRLPYPSKVQYCCISGDRSQIKRLYKSSARVAAWWRK